MRGIQGKEESCGGQSSCPDRTRHLRHRPPGSGTGLRSARQGGIRARRRSRRLRRKGYAGQGGSYRGQKGGEHSWQESGRRYSADGGRSGQGGGLRSRTTHLGLRRDIHDALRTAATPQTKHIPGRLPRREAGPSCPAPTHLGLRHDHRDALCVELRPPSSPDHLQAHAAVVLAVAGQRRRWRSGRRRQRSRRVRSGGTGGDPCANSARHCRSIAVVAAVPGTWEGQ